MDDAPNLAIYCDFENIAIGVRDAEYDNFDIQIVLERLLDKGKIVVKKAYADWDRYKGFKRPLHEAAFELIEVPHVSYSGKNSADIRLVVDALDLCYTKAHVDAFVILSGDSDFSPLVSKLRENDKKVIGLGVKNSTSDLLIENCDEFIYYDDLVQKKGNRKGSKGHGRRGGGGRRGSTPVNSSPAKGAPQGNESPPQAKAGPASKDTKKQATSAPNNTPERAEQGQNGGTSTERKNGAQPDRSAGPAKNRPLTEEELSDLREQAIELVLDTVEALFEERDGSLWGSMVKQTLKRKRPNFSETRHGYDTFSQLLEDAERQGLLELHRDDKSGGYIISSFGPNA